jgi:FkbM family methyltransferase
VINKIVNISNRDWKIVEDSNVGQFYDSSREIFDLKVYDYHKCSINKNEVVIDVGANIGMFSIYCLEKEVKQVIAIEPGSCFSVLKENTEDFKDKVIYINKGAWSYNCKLDFLNVPEWPVQGSIRGQMQFHSSDFDVVQIDCMSIDHIVNLLKLDQVDFIKIDSEGSEKEILLGAKYTIKVFKPKLAVCLYHNKDDWNILPKTIFNFVRSYKYTPISYSDGCDIGYFY